jgi:hypothetical protein
MCGSDNRGEAVRHVGSCRQWTSLAIYGHSRVIEELFNLEHNLVHLGGVTRASIDAVTRMAYIEYCPLRCTVDDLLAAVRTMGFQAYEHDPHYHG